MLTKHQRDLIAERKGAKNKNGRAEWKTGDYALRQYLKNQLDSMGDLLDVFDVLPDKQIKKVITPKQLADILKVLEKLLELHPPIEVKPDEEGNLRVVRYFHINMASRLRGLNNAVTGSEVSYLATEDEAEFWKEFRYIALYIFKNIMDDLQHAPKNLTRKEFNNLIKPIIENRKEVRIAPGGWTVGDAKDDYRDVDPLIDAERKVLSMKSKKLIKEAHASIEHNGEHPQADSPKAERPK
jgi:hypothetical protein